MIDFMYNFGFAQSLNKFSLELSSFEIPWLTIIILFPILASLLIPFIPDNQGKNVRWYALAVCLIDFALITFVFGLYYDFNSSSLQLVDNFDWIPFFQMNWSLGVDGLSMPLILLTGFVTTLATLGAWPITKNPKLFYALMLLMYSGQIGVFASQNILMFFFMWELELLPIYFLMSLWGGKKRLYASTKFILYTALASLFILIGGMSLAFYGDFITFDLSELRDKIYPANLQFLVYLGFLFAFGTKLAAFPFHTWLPDTHGEAHSTTCMLLAGILLKMGGYSLIRFNLQLLPEAHHFFAPFLIVLGVLNIIYAALTAFAQRNLKRKIAYSSVSHMGFVLIGIASFTSSGLSGAMLQMISHGLIGASLFFLTGLTYDRVQTLRLEDLGGLAQSMPKVFAMFTLVSLASLALPGLSGFIAELMIFLGFITSSSYSSFFKALLTFFEAFGILLTPIYLLSMLRQVFYGFQQLPAGPNALVSLGAEGPIPVSKMADFQISKKLSYFKDTRIFVDAGPREIFILTALVIPMIGIGLYPQFCLNLYTATTDAIILSLNKFSSL